MIAELRFFHARDVRPSGLCLLSPSHPEAENLLRETFFVPI